MIDKIEQAIHHPEKKLEDVRAAYNGNVCNGRGRATAAGRGYNTERLAAAVFNSDGIFAPSSIRNWYDTAGHSEGLMVRVECKSCVYQYPSDAYGQFRIWLKNHYSMLYVSDWRGDDWPYLYFLLVYDVEDGKEREIGKVIAPVEVVHEALDKWREVDHPTMGTAFVRDISWRLLCKRLGVSEEQLRAEPVVTVCEETDLD